MKIAEKRAAKRVIKLVDELVDILEDYPLLAGYLKNEEGNQAYLEFLEDLEMVGYNCHIEIENSNNEEFTI